VEFSPNRLTKNRRISEWSGFTGDPSTGDPSAIVLNFNVALRPADDAAGMDLTSSPLFSLLRDRMAWLGQRQKVLAENVANADTPGFRPRDLAPMRFGDALRAVDGGEGGGHMAVTNPAHLAGSAASAGAEAARVETAKQAYETNPSGNAVVLEEQMAKINETTTQHQLASQLYRKSLGLLKIAIAAKG
jgi:flagellar basal-body rod protein FlgB